jgi:hypothetical protein
VLRLKRGHCAVPEYWCDRIGFAELLGEASSVVWLVTGQVSANGALLPAVRSAQIHFSGTDPLATGGPNKSSHSVGAAAALLLLKMRGSVGRGVLSRESSSAVGGITRRADLMKTKRKARDNGLSVWKKKKQQRGPATCQARLI